MSVKDQQGAFPFLLASPPTKSFKTKHRPQPIIATHRPIPNSPYRTYRRRSSTSCSTASPAACPPTASTTTPRTPHTPYTPHTPSAAIAAAAPSAVFGSHSYYPRRKSQQQHHTIVHVHAPPSSPHGTKPRSPRRRRASPPSTPFAPPSPLRARSRGDSISAATATAANTAPRLPKLSKIRSLTHLRGSPALPSPPALPPYTHAQASHSHSQTRTVTMITTVSATPPPNSKRAKRSATPAKNSHTFQKYRPMPFIQQMQILQFMEGGTLESHIQRHHAVVGAGPTAAMTTARGGGHDQRGRGKGAAITGKGKELRVGGEEEIAHGYAFMDERGMIWFDEEEEWEFACLIPKVERGAEKKGKLMRMLGATKKREEEDEEDGWERFGSSSEGEEEAGKDGWVMGEQEGEDEDDLRSFGGDVAMRRPEQSVLKISSKEKPRPKGKQRRKRASSGSKKPATATATATSALTPPKPDTRSIRQEFLSSSFVPSPTTQQKHAIPSPPSHPPTHNSKPSLALPGMFKRHRSASHFNLSSTSTPALTPPTTKLYTKSANPSAVSLASHNHNDIQWAWTEMPKAPQSSSSSSGRPSTSTGRSVSPPLAAAKRLGIEPAVGGITVVSLEPMKKKKGGFFGRR